MASLKQRLEDFYRRCPEGLGRAEQWDSTQAPVEGEITAPQHEGSPAEILDDETAVLMPRPLVQPEHLPD